MTKHAILYPVLGLALLLCGVWIVKQEISQARAEERSKASSEAQAVIDKERADNKAQIKQALDALEIERKRPATLQSVTKDLSLPLPSGSHVAIEPAQGPDKPAQVTLTGDVQTNLDWIKNMELDHAKCDASLSGCQKDSGFINDKLLQMTKDRDNWEQTAKGGSKVHRFLKVLKVVGCAGGGAALGSLAKWKGAAIGAGAGAATCSIF